MIEEVVERFEFGKMMLKSLRNVRWRCFQKSSNHHLFIPPFSAQQRFPSIHRSSARPRSKTMPIWSYLIYQVDLRRDRKTRISPA